MEKPKYANFRNAKVVEVLKVEVNEGDGVESDPVRRVAYLVSLNTGKVLAKIGENIEREFAGDDEEVIEI